jgi:hypothetical protein
LPYDLAREDWDKVADVHCRMDGCSGLVGSQFFAQGLHTRWDGKCMTRKCSGLPPNKSLERTREG